MSEKADIVERLYITPHFITADEFGFPYTMPHEITQRNKEERYEAASEIYRLRKERDEARRLVCEFHSAYNKNNPSNNPDEPNDWTPQQIAEINGWDCFKKDIL